MISGRRNSDWTRDEKPPAGERRASDRRAPRRRIDPLFAATLINQIKQGEDSVVGGYAARAAPAPGGARFNFRA